GEGVETAKKAVGEGVDTAKKAVGQGVGAATKAAIDKADAGSAAVTQKVEAAKNAIGTQADAAAHKVEDVKQADAKCGEQASADKRYAMLKEALQDAPVGDPALHAASKAWLEYAEAIQTADDMQSDDPAARAAGMQKAEARLREFYAGLYPAVP